MVFPFGKKKEEEKPAPGPAPGQNYVPTDLVQRLASQGMSEPEIISRLRREGFAPSQINDALRSQIKREVAPAPQPRQMPPQAQGGPQPLGMRPQQMPPQQAPPQRQMPPQAPQPMAQPPMPSRGIQMPQRQEMPGAPPAPQRQAPRFQPPERVVGPGMAPRQFEEAPSRQQMFTFEQGPETESFDIGPEEITLEELVEGIVSDKWDEFEDRLGNFEKRDIQLQAQIEDMRKKMAEMEKMLKERESTYVGKLDDVNESMDVIEGRIGSIEKVFKDTLPELTQSIRTLSEHTVKIKEKEEK